MAQAVSAALAWLKQLHIFVARLQSELLELASPRANAPASRQQDTVAHKLLDAHHKMAGIETVCNRANCGQLPDKADMADDDDDHPLLRMLLKSKHRGFLTTRSSSGERSDSIAAVKAPVQRLAPVARVPYMKHYYQKVCL